MQDQQNPPFWRELQQGRYPNSYSITPIESIQDVLVNNKNIAEKFDNATNIIAVNEQAKNHVMNLTNNDIDATNFILSEFNPNDMIAINQYFDKIKNDIKKDFPKGLTKDAFVQYIKTKVTPNVLSSEKGIGNSDLFQLIDFHRSGQAN